MANEIIPRDNWSLKNRALRKALNTHPEDMEIKAIREGIQLLISKNGRIGAIATLAKFLAKEAGAQVTDADYDAASALVQEVTSGSQSGIIAEVFGRNQSDTFTNRPSPGMPKPIIGAGEDSTGYPR